jgi:CubicO group peptidase (beta-lactamase class C family)
MRISTLRHATATAALLASFALPAAARAQTTGPRSPLAPTVDSIATRILAQTGVPSASVAVVTHGRLAYAQAYGAARLEPHRYATPDMRYAIGSISKQFTAGAILLLQQQGKLSLDDPVGRYVPGLTLGNAVTIRQILSHTSGYQDFWPQDYVPPSMERSITPQAILDHWAKQPLDFMPGARWQYSNTNYTLAGLIVQQVSGVPFFQFIQDNILTPLGITDAVDFDARGPGAIEPVGYMRYGLGPLRPAPSTGSGWMWGAGELALTPRDLAKWDIAMMTQTLLAPASWHAMETTIVRTDGVSTNYGLGVDVGTVRGHRLVEHNGEVSGFTAENMVLPDDSAAVIVLTNQDAAPAAGAIAQAIAPLLVATEDAQTTVRTALARRIFEGLQRGTLDRSLFTPDANAYFSPQALADFQSSLAPLGAPTGFVQVGQQSRGGMLERSYQVTFPSRTLRVWTYEMPDGKLEQYQVAPVAGG